MQVPYFIKIACKKVYEEEEDMINEYLDLQEEVGNNLDKLMKKIKAQAHTESFYEDVKLEDHKGKIKTSSEMVTYLYDNNHKVPVLIVFANKLLKMARDFYEDLSTTNKYHSLVNFFELFHSVAEAGPLIRCYMIENYFIGRLMDIYYHKTSDNKHYMRDLSYMPTYEIICNDREEEISASANSIPPDGISADDNTDFDFALRLKKRRDEKDYLVVEKEKKNKNMQDSDDDESPSLTVLKGAKESDEKRFAYLLRAVATLVCSCRFTVSGKKTAEDSLFLKAPIAYDLPPNEDREIELLYSDRVANDLLLRSNPSISTREALNDMYAHICYDNEEASTSLLQLLVHEICNPDCTFLEVIKHTPLIVNIAKINDGLTKNRMKYLMQNLFERTFIDQFRTYIKYSDSILNLILLVIRRNYDACKYLRELPDVLAPIEKFHGKNPYPKATSKSQILFRKISNDKVDKKLTEDDKTILRNYGEHRLALFRDLLVDVDFEDHIETYIKQEGNTFADPDIVYLKNDNIDYYKEEFKYWITAKVIEDYGPVVMVSYRTPNLVLENSRGIEERKN